MGEPRDRPWLMRTYAGHSTARESNALFRRNLAKGQTGLSVAFDLPTQTGYDADHVLARGEVGRVGVPVGHLGDMRALFEGIALERGNTSMTINATAMWLLALYQVVAEEQGAGIAALTGTTQNDIIKEYLSRGTSAEIGAGRLRLLLGKPGLDGHSNGIEQIAVRARDAGFEVIYSGIRLTPDQIAAAAVAEDVHCVGLSILSGGHAELVPDVLLRLRRAGAGDIPVVAGGIIPPADAQILRSQGVAAVFTPADFDISAIVSRIVDEIRRARSLEPWSGRAVLTIESDGKRDDHHRDARAAHHEPAAPAPFLPGRARQQPALPG